MQIVECNPKDLKASEYNPRQMTKEQVEDLTESIKRFGLVDPIIVNNHKDRENIVVGGHQRLKIASILGLDSVPVVYVNLDEKSEQELNLRLNKNLGEWDYNLLANFDEELLKDVGWNSEELDKIFQLDIDEKDDEIPEIKERICKEGDLWQLGNHRLLCGDSTKKEDVERLMDGKKADMVFTDPPYGINLNTIWEKKRRTFKKIAGDENYFDISFLFDLGIEEICIFGADYFLPVISKYSGTMLVWDKRVEEAKDRMMLSAFEMLWVNKKVKKVIFRKMWGSFLGGKERLEVVHPTQKPLSLLIDVMIHLKADKNIIDLFGGSGSILIACEKLNRNCYMMEIDPHYCDVIIERWQNFTNQKAVKL